MSQTRRQALKTIAACGCCAAGYATANAAPSTKPAQPFDAGAVSDFGNAGVYDQYAKQRKLLIIRNHDTLIATSGICTHRNCVLKKTKTGGLLCPCHKSAFNLDGIPLDGPAKTSLPRFAIRIENGRVLIDMSKAFEERDWNDPAASVTVASAS